MPHPIVQALQDRFVLGMLLGDADLWAGVYAEDARLVPPDRRVRVGRDEIRRYWQDVLDEGSRIIERGVYARFDHPVRVGPPVARGSYLVVIDQQPDGSWAWTTDVWDARDLVAV